MVGTTTLAARNTPFKVSEGKNLDATKGMKDKKIIVPRDDDVSQAIHGDLKKIVVVLVSTGLNMLRRLDEFRCGGKKVEKLLRLGLAEITAELEARGNLTKFG